MTDRGAGGTGQELGDTVMPGREFKTTHNDVGFVRTMGALPVETVGAGWFVVNVKDVKVRANTRFLVTWRRWGRQGRDAEVADLLSQGR